VPSFGSTAGPYTPFEGLQELYKDVFDIPRKKQLQLGSMKRAGSQRFTKLIGIPTEKVSFSIYKSYFLMCFFKMKKRLLTF